MCQIGGAFDLRRYKMGLRRRYARIRSEIPPERKAEKDEKIRRRVMSLPEYEKCGLMLCYVSTKYEADTRNLIEHAISGGKEVAVPYCVKGTRDMEFYLISSLKELVHGTFGVDEPVPDPSKLVRDYSGSICMLPGIVFDVNGYRLGYGGGYYDRFLSKYYENGFTIGLAYSECVTGAIRRGRYDINCKLLVTDLFFKRTG